MKFYKDKNYKKAFMKFKKSAECDPAYPEAQYNLGVFYEFGFKGVVNRSLEKADESIERINMKKLWMKRLSYFYTAIFLNPC